MTSHDHPGPLDLAIVILSPVIVAGFAVILLLSFLTAVAWRWVRGEG
jgi:hypothetical protein